jgi:hypothetical protein
MAFKPGRLAEITVATKALSLFCETADIDVGVATGNTSTFTQTWETNISGMASVSLTLSGYYDPTITTGPASVLLAQIALNQAGTVTAVIFYPAGNNAGQGTSHTFNALITSYKEAPAAQGGGAVAFSATLLGTGADTIAQL